jgi:hypothetical protein
MTTREMHYDFKRKFNKIDSQKNRNLLVPEIDWLLNEAAELFVKKVSNPKVNLGLGFETSQRTIDDIKSIVVHGTWIPFTNNIITLPSDYLYYVRGRVRMSKKNCTNKEGVLYIREHRDLFEENEFYKSSFEWREVNGLFTEQGIQVFTDDTFTINEAKLSYIRKWPYFHNAQDFNGGSYADLDGVVLTGTVQCDLPEHVHREIVDIAVMLASSEVPTSDFQLKAGKLGFNQIV